MNDACDDGQRWRIVAYCGKVATILRAKTLILKPKLRQVVTQYKMWNEVMLWLTQMMCYNAYIPFIYLLYKANERYGGKFKPYKF